MGHHRKCNKFCDKPRKFHDKVGKGSLDSTPIIVPKNINFEEGSSLNLPATLEDPENPHPGPFVAAAFHPSSQKFFGLGSRRNTPSDSPERAGRVLMDDKERDCDTFYKPRIKKIDRNFVKKSKKKK